MTDMAENDKDNGGGGGGSTPSEVSAVTTGPSGSTPGSLQSPFDFGAAGTVPTSAAGNSASTGATEQNGAMDLLGAGQPPGQASSPALTGKPSLANPTGTAISSGAAGGNAGTGPVGAGHMTPTQQPPTTTKSHLADILGAHEMHQLTIMSQPVGQARPPPNNQAGE